MLYESEVGDAGLWLRVGFGFQTLLLTLDSHNSAVLNFAER